METPNQPIQEKTPEIESRATQSMRRLYGVAALTLVFIGSAFFTFEYFSNVPHSDPAQQVAAAALPTIDPYKSTTLIARSAIVIDLRSGRILYSHNAQTQLPLASLTKIPLALVVSEVLTPNQSIVIPYDTAPTGNAERLAAGDTWKVRDIINFTLIASSNEGAEILAAAANEEIHRRFPQSPVDGATIWRMNQLVQALGLRDMYFLNPSGLDESTTQSGAYGSAHDVATLFAYAASTSAGIFSGTTRDGMLLTSENGGKTTAYNTNSALGSIPGLVMGKTGYTNLAGGNLAVVFDVGPAHPVVAVVLGSTESGRFEDMKKLIAATEEAIALER